MSKAREFIKIILRKYQTGFTLVEILIVIGILGVLSTVGFTSYTATQKNSRDSRRKIDLETIKQALEVYKSDKGTYIYAVTDTWQNILSPYLSNVPEDPRNTTNGFYYNYVSLGCTGPGPDYSPCARFRLWARLENPPPINPADCPLPETVQCGSNASDTCNYCIHQP